jgi:hypothetical protein
MDQSWPETKLLLASIHQEYIVICQELKITTDSQRAIRLRALAIACLTDYREVTRQYHAAKQRPPLVSP